ncbi:hypothetical protein AN642_00165 [Epulopiscium sp. SCG-B10WGA-EpuloA2]|nr:hypothetical protein AN642_00165 [Epulopiscium sp. SCG-B10WGA-EpuloA2]
MPRQASLSKEFLGSLLVSSLAFYFFARPDPPAGETPPHTAVNSVKEEEEAEKGRGRVRLGLFIDKSR